MNKRNLKYVDCGLWKTADNRLISLVAYWKNYGFSLEITDEDAELDENGEAPVIFKKFLRTADEDYACNYLRKVAKNNYGAERYA